MQILLYTLLCLGFNNLLLLPRAEAANTDADTAETVQPAAEHTEQRDPADSQTAAERRAFKAL